MNALDLIFFWGSDPTSWFISGSTSSVINPFYGFMLGPSHVAMVWQTERDGVELAESTTLAKHPCTIQGKLHDGFQSQKIETRINEYKGTIWHLPIAPIWRMNPAELFLLQHLIRDELIGRPYDYPGAAISGTRFVKRLYARPALAQLFCSEIVAALLQRFYRLPLEHPTRYSPARLLRAAVASGVWQAPVVVKRPFKLNS